MGDTHKEGDSGKPGHCWLALETGRCSCRDVCINTTSATKATGKANPLRKRRGIKKTD